MSLYRFSHEREDVEGVGLEHVTSDHKYAGTRRRPGGPGTWDRASLSLALGYLHAGLQRSCCQRWRSEVCLPQTVTT